jgi:hypothetical protein
MTISVDPENNEPRALFTLADFTRAKENTPDDLKSRVEFRHIAFEDFAAENRSSIFDIAILSWALC